MFIENNLRFLKEAALSLLRISTSSSSTTAASIKEILAANDCQINGLKEGLEALDNSEITDSNKEVALGHFRTLGDTAKTLTSSTTASFREKTFLVRVQIFAHFAHSIVSTLNSDRQDGDPSLETKVREIFRDFISWKVIQQAIDKQAKSDSIFRSMFDSQSSIIDRHGILVEVSSLRGVVNGLLGKEVCVIERTDTQSKVTGRDNSIELCSLPSPMVLNGKQEKNHYVSFIKLHKNYLYVAYNSRFLQVWNVSDPSNITMIDSVVLNSMIIDMTIYGCSDADLPDRLYICEYLNVIVYDLPNSQTKLTLRPSFLQRSTLSLPAGTNGTFAIRWCYHNTRLYVAYSDNIIVSHNLLTMTVIDETSIRVQEHETFNDIAITLNGKYLLTACRDSCIRIWNVWNENSDSIVPTMCCSLDHNFDNNDSSNATFVNDVNNVIPFQRTLTNPDNGEQQVSQRVFTLFNGNGGCPVWELTTSIAETGELIMSGKVITRLTTEQTDFPCCYHIDRNRRRHGIVDDRDCLFIGYCFRSVCMWDMISLEKLMEIKMTFVREINEIVVCHDYLCATFMGAEIQIWSISKEALVGTKVLTKKHRAQAIAVDKKNSVFYSGDICLTAYLL